MEDEIITSEEPEVVAQPEAPEGEASTPPPGEDAQPEEQKVPLKALQEERRKRQEAEERNQRFERIFDEKMKPEPEPQQTKAPQVPPGFPAKPALESFETYDEYVDALTDWKTDLKFAQRDFQTQVQQQKTQHQQVYEDHGKRTTEAKARYPDFDAVIAASSDIPARQELISAIVESDVSGDLLYHLAKNPAEVEKLNNLPERAMLRELGKIESRIATGVAPKKASNAPPPIAPVGSGGGKVAKAIADMTDEEFLESENQKAAARGRLW